MERIVIAVVVTVSVLMGCGKMLAGEATPVRIKLPVPEKAGGMALADALSARRSTRSFTDVELSPQEPSDLPWATAGVNRSDCRTTYPVAMGRKDMTLFVVAKSGVFCYDPDAHALEPVVAGDHRADTGAQPFVAQASVNFIFVQDMALWDDSEQSRRQGESWGYVHTGAMVQNAYLHAASRNWSAVVRGLFDGGKLKALLKLAPMQKVTITQSIGSGQ